MITEQEKTKQDHRLEYKKHCNTHAFGIFPETRLTSKFKEESIKTFAKKCRMT